MNEPTAFSLFSGIGGMDEGLRRAGFRHVAMCESDEWRRSILRARFPGVPVYEDVRSVAVQPVSDTGRTRRMGGGFQRGHSSRCANEEPASEGATPVALLCGGFPCQDLSVAGQRRGLAGERSSLFFEYARIADALRPRWLLVENVPGLLSSNGGRDFGIVLGTLADLGYGLGWRILDSRFFGVPQRRRRVFILGALAAGDPRAAAERAGQVLAVGTRCPGHPPQGVQTGPDVAYALADGSGSRTGSGRDGQDTYVASLSGLGTGGPDDNDGQGGLLVARSLSHGSNPNSNMAGRRREDDENLVTAFYPTGGSKDGFWQEDVAPPMKVGTGVGAPAGIGVAVPDTPDGYNAWDALPAEAHASQVLRRLRDEVGAEAFEEWSLGVVAALRAASVLRPLLYGEGVYGPEAYGFAILGDGALPRAETLADWAVRVLRQYAERRCPPQGRRLAQQRAPELAAALSELPQPDAPVAFMRALWEASQGLRLLRQALSAVQEVGRPTCGEAEPAHGAASVRRLTPQEAERLQGLPDGWTLPGADSRRYAGLGDAVTATVAEWIGHRIRDSHGGCVSRIASCRGGVAVGDTSVLRRPGASVRTGKIRGVTNRESKDGKHG